MEKGKTGTVNMKNNFDFQDDELFNGILNMLVKSSKTKGYDKVKKNIYFAGPWFDERANKLYDACKEIIDNIGKNYSVFYPREQVNTTPKEAFIKNVNNIATADIIIALVSRKDVGTAWEIGMAYAMKKPVYLLGYDESTFLSHTNVMLAFTGKCFTLSNLAKFLTVGLEEEEFVKINNEWKGIE